jgi:hypothetical protein
MTWIRDPDHQDENAGTVVQREADAVWRLTCGWPVHDGIHAVGCDIWRVRSSIALR